MCREGENGFVYRLTVQRDEVTHDNGRLTPLWINERDSDKPGGPIIRLTGLDAGLFFDESSSSCRN